MSDQNAVLPDADGRDPPAIREVGFLHKDSIMDLVRLTESSLEEDLVQSFSSALAVTNVHKLEDSESVLSSRKQQCLNDLPDDLLLRIFSMCDARAVGRLRQCCKDFCRLSIDQVVWLSVLKRTCTELNLPMPSFSQSAFTNSEVESSANAWLRFLSVLRNAKLRNAEDGQTLPHKTVRLIGIQERVHSFDQSPDGQFLCIIQSSGIRVWNIETPSPTKVGSFDIELPDDCWSHMTVIFESDNSFLLYPVVNSPSRGLSQWLSFRFTFSFHAHEGYQMDLLSRLDRLSFPSIQWYGAAMIPTVPFLATCFKHNSGGKYYVLWDPVSDTCACWIADINDTSTSPIILIANDFIIALDDVTQDTFVYTRPEIPPKDSYAPGVCAWLNNPALLHVPAEGERLNRRTVSTMYWKTLPNRGHLACNHDGWALIHDTGDENWILERVEIRLTDSSSSTFAPLPLVCERLHSQHPRFLPIGGGWSGTVDVCPDQSILLHTTSKQQTKVLFHLSSSNENEDGAELGRGVLYDSRGAFEITGRHYSLCLFAGRMCIVTPDGIEVVDFV